MYMTRNPDYEMLMKIFDEVHVSKFADAPKNLKTILTGRTLQCGINIFDLIPRGEHGD